MAAFPPTIPPLPSGITAWPANLLVVHDSLSDLYQHALQSWHQEDADPLRLNCHLGTIEDNVMQLLLAIEGDPIGIRLPEWLAQTTELFAELHLAITCYRDSVRNR